MIASFSGNLDAGNTVERGRLTFVLSLLSHLNELFLLFTFMFKPTRLLEQ